MRVQTQSIHFKADQKLVQFIERKIQKLETFFDRIIDVNIILRLENTGQIRDKIAEIKLNIPRGLLIAKENKKTFEASVDAAVESLRRQLIKYKQRKRVSL